MRKIKPVSTIIVLLILFFMSSESMAMWSVPEPIIELNDLDNGQVASNPIISSDGLTLYFLRKGADGHNYQMEAIRESIDAPFTSMRVLSELGCSGGCMFRPWVSPDHLQMYYSEAVPENGQWGGFDTLKMAVRKNESDLWIPIKIFSDIHVRGSADKRPSLTQDSCTMMWISDRFQPERHTYKIWIADRPTLWHEFLNVRPVQELDEIGAAVPYLSADGLAVYFSRANPDGFHDLWQGGRASLDEPFGDFTAIEELNQPTIHSLNPCVSPDGQSLYFFLGAPDMDIADKGIYVSHWVDPPFDIAVKNLNEAIALKEEAAEMVDLAMEKEAQAMEILASLPPERTPDHLTAEQLQEARIHIMQALRRQVVARDNLRRGLMYLNSALLGILPPIWVDEAVEPAP